MADTAEAVKATEAKVLAGPRVYASLQDILSSGVTAVEYKEIAGFTDGTAIRIGSVSAGDMMVFQEASAEDDSKKREAGLRLICKSLVGPEPENLRYLDGSESVIRANMAQLRAIRYKETERITREIIALNGMRVRDDAAAKKD